MNWLPWISRSTHAEMISRLENECFELKKERIVLLDRLALIGLGSPLYSAPAGDDQKELNATEPVTADPDHELVEQLMRLRRRPAKLADQLTREYRDRRAPARRLGATPTSHGVAASLAQAESLGREIGKAQNRSGLAE